MNIQRLLDEAYGRVADVTSHEPLPPSEFRSVVKMSAHIPVSCCHLTDATGENHCEHPPPPPIPWRRQLRWRVQSWWSGRRMRLGSWVAGVDLDRDYDD